MERVALQIIESNARQTSTERTRAIAARKILFIVPYKARDLDGLALVAYHLRNKYGHDVEFSNGYGIEHKLLQYGPDAFVMDHLVWDFKARQLRLAKELGMKALVLPTEGFHKTKDEALRIAGKLTHTSHIVDCHFAWGDFVRDAVLEEQLAREDQIHTIGCPRFDFYSKPYLSLMKPRAEFLSQLGIRNPDAPVVLWATSTSYASRNQRKLYRRHVTRGSIPEEEVHSYLEDGLTQFRESSKLILDLANRHPDWNFIVKVHPAEWINPYVEMVKGKDNLCLGFDAPIREFLYHCDVLLQRGCTTGTEAWMLNKPVLELQVGKYNLDPLEEYVAGNHLVTSVDEADKAISYYLSGGSIDPEQRLIRSRFIEKHYYRVDGKSSERCAEQIHRVITPPDYTDRDRSKREDAIAKAYSRWKAEQDARFFNRLKDLVGIKRSVSLRLWKLITFEAQDNLGRFVAEPDISSDMISELYARLDSLFGIDSTSLGRDFTGCEIREGDGNFDK